MLIDSFLCNDLYCFIICESNIMFKFTSSSLIPARTKYHNVGLIHYLNRSTKQPDRTMIGHLTLKERINDFIIRIFFCNNLFYRYSFFFNCFI